MRILLTGASSFTGYWFVRELAAAGHRVTATLSSADSPQSYAGTRAERVDRLRPIADIVFAAPMGSDRLFEIIRTAPAFDVFCHHWADVRDYRSADYDVLAALAANAGGLAELLQALNDRGCGHFVLTGSVFEEEEGAGSRPMRAFSPYGLAKSLTWRYVRYYCERAGIDLCKFVIANPFGPFEEPRFTDYLMRSWYRGETARVATPRYVRDNIPVDLLAKSYARFVAGCRDPGARQHLAPSGYAESQGAFARRVGAEVSARLGLACRLDFADQQEFAEPFSRIGIDPTDSTALGWSESAAWDGFADYYRSRYGNTG